MPSKKKSGSKSQGKSKKTKKNSGRSSTENQS